MMIKLICNNDNCGYSYSVSETEFKENGQYYVNCLVCGAKNKVNNLEEVIEQDMYQRAEKSINLWIKELGLEGCIELIERNSRQACYRIYKEILENKGLKLKKEQ